MKKLSISLICTLLIMQLISCKKDKVINPDVYICGTELNTTTGNYDAVMWKNGDKQLLGKTTGQHSSYARAVFVNGNDVYIAGDAQVGVNTTAVVWKNGVWSSPIDGSPGSATCIFVNGTDVYAAGNSNGKAAIWKNGIQTILSTTLSEVTDIYVTGNDVYACGYVASGFGYFVRAVWKNGTQLPYLVLANIDSRAHSIKVIGDDIFVSGEEQISSGGDYTSRIWKNGTEIFSNANYFSYDYIDVVGSDIYTAGIGGFAGAYNSVIAKNNVALYTTTAPPSISITGMRVKNSDVYYCGQESPNKVIYWKNGQKTILSTDTTAFAYDLFVK